MAPQASHAAWPRSAWLARCYGYHRELHYPLRRQRQMCIRDSDNIMGFIIRLDKIIGWDITLAGKLAGGNLAYDVGVFAKYLFHERPGHDQSLACGFDLD